MRVNVYAEEMTDRVEIIGKEIEGRTFTGLRFYLELPATVNGRQYQGPFNHRDGDDDSSAVTFWGKRDLRAVLRKALALLDEHYAARAAYHNHEGNMNAPQSVAQLKTISVPPLGEISPGKGGRFAGIGIGPDGTNQLLFVHELHSERPMTWSEYLEWCKTLEADGHRDFRPMTRHDGALVYATMKEQMKRDWYWLGEEYAGDAEAAWIQYFGDGGQLNGRGGGKYLACAVRSEPI